MRQPSLDRLRHAVSLAEQLQAVLDDLGHGDDEQLHYCDRDMESLRKRITRLLEREEAQRLEAVRCLP